MKFSLPFLTILPAVFANGAVERRAQSAVDDWLITAPGNNAITYAGSSQATGTGGAGGTDGSFSIDFIHGNAGTNKLAIYKLGGTATPNVATPDSPGPGGGNNAPGSGGARNSCRTQGGELVGTIISGAGGTSGVPFFDPAETSLVANSLTSTTFTWKFNEAISAAGDQVFYDGPGVGPDIAMFCLYFYKEDGFDSNNPQEATFVEVGFKMTFTYDGTFELDGFATQPLIPANDNNSDTFYVDVGICNGAAVNVFNQLEPIPVCVCPLADNIDTAPMSISRIDGLIFNDDPSTTTDTSSMTAPEQTVIQGSIPQTGTTAVTCNPGGIAGDSGVAVGTSQNVVAAGGASIVVPAGCCRIDTFLRSDFFPGDVSNPKQIAIKLSGVAWLQIGSALDGGFAAGNADPFGSQRRLTDRSLQTNNANELPFEDIYVIETELVEEDNSAAATTANVASMSLLALAGAALAL